MKKINAAKKPKKPSTLHLLPEAGAPDVLYLLDLSSVARAIYEGTKAHLAPAKKDQIDDPSNVSVVEGVLSRVVNKVLVDQRPAFFGVCFDVIGEKGFRAGIWPEYKAGRKAPGPGYPRQIQTLLEVFAAHRIPCFQGGGFEADDWIATLTRRARLAGLRVVVVSKDQDLWQTGETANPRGVVFWDGDEDVYTAEDCQRVYGVGPEQLRDALALSGDTDEAPGVDGIGTKTAGALIAKYGDLETALSRWAEETKGKIGEKLRDGAASAILSRRLVTLAYDAPVSLPLRKLALGWDVADNEKIRRLGVKLGIEILKTPQPCPKPTLDESEEMRWLAAGAAVEEYAAELRAKIDRPWPPIVPEARPETQIVEGTKAEDFELPPLPADPVEAEERAAIEGDAPDAAGPRPPVGERAFEEDFGVPVEDLEREAESLGRARGRRLAREAAPKKKGGASAELDQGTIDDIAERIGAYLGEHPPRGVLRSDLVRALSGGTGADWLEGDPQERTAIETVLDSLIRSRGVLADGDRVRLAPEEQIEEEIEATRARAGEPPSEPPAASPEPEHNSAPEGEVASEAPAASDVGEASKAAAEPDATKPAKLRKGEPPCLCPRGSRGPHKSPCPGARTGARPVKASEPNAAPSPPSAPAPGSPLSVACPRCKAAVGARCIDVSRRPCQSHRERKLKANPPPAPPPKPEKAKPVRAVKPAPVSLQLGLFDRPLPPERRAS